MRLNKKKLAALAMSAVMAASTMPFPVMAEEEGFTDFIEFTDEEEATAAEAEAEAETNRYSVTWSAKLVDGEVEATATYSVTVEGVEKNRTAKADVVKTYAADCTNTMRVDAEVWIENEKYEGKGIAVEGSETTNHVWGENVTKTVTEQATCTVAGKMDVTKTCTKCGATETEKDVTIPATGHTWEVIKTEYVLSQTTDNSVIPSNNNIKLVVDKNGAYVRDENNNYQLDLKDGKPQVINPAESGTYYVKTTRTCTACNDAEVTNETTATFGGLVVYTPETIKANQVTMYTITETDSNITGVVNNEFSLSTNAQISADLLQKLVDKDSTTVNKILLADCSKDSKIVVTYSVEGSSSPITRTVTIPAHHQVVTVYETTSSEDAALLKKTVGTDGKVTITNTSCYKDIVYYVTEYCQTAGKCNLTEKANIRKYQNIFGEETNVVATWKVLNRTSEKAVHSGNHSIVDTVKTAITNLLKNEYKENGATVTGTAVNGALTAKGAEKLAALVEANKDYVKISKNTATCTEGGMMTVEFICRVCDQTVDNVTVKTAKLEHVYNYSVDEATEVKATCESRGQYDVAWLCTRCGKEDPDRTSERTTYYTKRLPHTNEESVLDSGVTNVWKDATAITDSKVESYITFTGDKVIDNNGELLGMVGKTYKTSYGFLRRQAASMSAKVYTDCATCHNNPHVVVNDPTIKVVDIQKESATGEAGYIKLEASYKAVYGTKTKTVTAEITVPYYSSTLAYQGRVEPEVINGLHTDKDGFTRYYEDGKVVETTGIIKYAGREYLVKDGVLCDSTHGVTLVGDTFYFLANGCVQRGYTGVAIYDNESFYLSNGVVDTNVNGLVPYQGGTFLFAAGRLVKEHNGLWQNSDGTWYFLALGQVQTQYTGVAEYDGAYFYVKSGKLDTTKNGTITVDGVKYTAVNGQLYK